MRRRRRATDVAAELVYQLSDLLFTSDAPLAELDPLGAVTAPVETQVQWRGSRPRPAAPGPRFSAWLTEDDQEWLTFADAPGGYRLTFPEYGDFDVTADASRVAIHPYPDSPPETMRHLLLNQVLPLVLSRRGRTVLHASAISHAGQVVAFIGRSGAGKSTLAVACARAGASVVADDCLVVHPADGRWLAVPCLAGVRLWPEALRLFGWDAGSGASTAHYSEKRRIDAVERGADDPRLSFETRTLPLTAILYMSTASSAVPTSPGALRGRNAAMAIASEVFRIDWRDPRESRRHFEAVSAIAADVSVEVPERLPPDAAARALLCRMTAGWRHS